jgi:hypothetical protein
VRPNFLDEVALIRSIQRAEGNPDCFRKSPGDCPENHCAWRRYCIEEFSEPEGGEMASSPMRFYRTL